MPVHLKAVSWGHRRATAPAAALGRRFTELNPAVAIDWDVRPLSDFEHQGIAEVAQRYDLIIYDHPFSGDIARSGSFVPLGGHLPELAIGNAAQFVGPSLTSYHYDGEIFGVPIDAATQHALVRADLMQGQTLPGSWDEVLALGVELKRRGLHLGYAGETPHAIATVAALMSNAGTPWSTDPGSPLSIDADGLRLALERHRALLSFAPAECLNWNAIDLHDAMVSRDDIAYAPCAYGYATYGEADMRRRLGFGPFPGPAGSPRGTMLGGTAIGISSRCAALPEALGFLRFCLTQEAQDEVIAGYHGQPALASAWSDAEIDRNFNGYFSAVRSSLDTAWIRPRVPDYAPFQRMAGLVVRQALADEVPVAEAVNRIQELADKVNRRK